MKIPGAPFSPGTPEPARPGLSGPKKTAGKVSGNPVTGNQAPENPRLNPGIADPAGVRAALRSAIPAGRAGIRADRAAPLTGRGPAENPVQTPRPAASRTLPDLRGLLSALKLPNDSLSKSLISFSRYFSLPLESVSAGALRREVLAQKKREAAALGAAAAAAKGLVLESRALAEYADAIDPAEWRDQQQSDQGQPDQPQSDQQQPNQRQPESEDIKRAVGAALERGPVPDFINRIPGKDGRRWIVIPFSFSGEGIDLKASFRVLLSDPKGNNSGAERFAADIAVFRDKELFRRWFFLLEGKFGKEFEAQRVEFSVFPPVFSRKIIIGELSKAFGLPRDKISPAREGDFMDSRGDLLRTVDEEV
jgi:hypothetical protein